MRVETFAPQASRWQAVQTAAREAEEAGFDGFASPEIAHDPFVPLAFAAVATERIQLHTAIAVAFPRSPMVVANTCWDLQQHSGGRFTLGLGTQVKAHNQRRFSVPWSKPRSRLREYVQALRAIWRTWEKKEKLDFQGEHYQFTLMTPEFAPEPTGLPPVAVYTAAVRPAMMKLAGEVCDGVRLHGFATRKYLEQVAMPAIEEGLASRNKSRASFDVTGGGFICTGPDADAVQEMFEWTRYRVAFYGSTPSYHPVLAAHGWDDLGQQLHQLSRQGKWEQMAKAVPDDVVHEFAAVAPYDGLKKAVTDRFHGISDTIAVAFPEATPAAQKRELIAELQSIDSPCKTPGATWDP